jgi:DNA topoisomerase-1
VVFHEITKNAVLEAIGNPREVAQDLVDAQQARRALDYLVGFNLSPLLWKKIRRGLSAGRVQSPALRLICERENEIKAFVQQEYWSVHLDSHKGRTKFSAKLTQLAGKSWTSSTFPVMPNTPTFWPACKTSRPPSPASRRKRSRAARPRPSPPRRCNRKPCASWA